MTNRPPPLPVRCRTDIRPERDVTPPPRLLLTAASFALDHAFEANFGKTSCRSFGVSKKFKAFAFNVIKKRG